MSLFAAEYAKDDNSFSETNSVANNEAGTDKLVAPGTTGSQAFTLENNSEVAVRFTLTPVTTGANATNLNGVPMEFSTNGSTWTTLDAALTARNCNIAVDGDNVTFTLYWRWAFTGEASTNFTSSQTDVSDTALGSAVSLANVIVTISIVATQID